MNTTILASAALDVSEKTSLSLEMMLRGLGTVFMVLIILWIIVQIFGRVFGGAGKTEKSPKPVKEAIVREEKPAKAASAPVPAKEAAPAPSAVQTQDDKELIAVITAAIAAYQSASGKPNLPFRVVSFTRKNNASGWMGNSADNQ